MNESDYRFSLQYAKDAASEILVPLMEVSRRISFAGSIRRKKSTVKDIEIVIEPKLSPDLLGEERFWFEHVIGALQAWALCGTIEMVKGGDRYRQFIWFGSGPDTNGCFPKVDLFIVHPPATWGVVLAIRTGPAQFSKKLVTQRNKGGLLPSFLRVENGRLLNDEGTVIPTDTEADFFRRIGVAMFEPEDR
jgi:DNA polymerase/3'-5' exonuclease PolX